MAYQPRVALAFLIAFIGPSIGTPASVVADTQGEAPRLETVIHRAGIYVTEFERQFARIIAEESYVQDITQTRVTSKVPPNFHSYAGPLGLPSHSPQPPASLVTHRELKSDLLLLLPQNADRYIEYRDVFSVDGHSVRDRRERLTELLDDPTSSQTDRFRRIADESARFNIGNVVRNINTPVLPLLFLMPDNQWRFKFKRATDSIPANVASPPRQTDRPEVGEARRRADESQAHFRVSTEVWVVEFKEVERHTIIRTPYGADRPAHGRFWIEPESGRVLMSELVAEDRALRATIDVSYQSQPVLSLLVPVEMRERYDLRREGTVITGSAVYSGFRPISAGAEPPGKLELRSDGP